MPSLKKIAVREKKLSISNGVEERSHANDPYVLKKIELAKEFIKRAGLPNLKKQTSL